MKSQKALSERGARPAKGGEDYTDSKTKDGKVTDPINSVDVYVPTTAEIRVQNLTTSPVGRR